VSNVSAPAADAAGQVAQDLDLARAREGDDAAFTRLVGPLRRELHAHCYRMLGSTHDGLEAATDFAVRVPLTACGSWRHLPTSANGQPAVAFYLRNGDTGAHLAWSITVLTLRGEQIAEITSFIGPDHFVAFGLPASVP
jgi:hypothetical protein